jgi:hypothetical protein
MELEVKAFEAVGLYDKEPYNRPVRLFTWEEVLALPAQGQLASGTAAVVARLGTQPLKT